MNITTTSHGTQVTIATSFIVVCATMAFWDIYALTRLSWYDTVSYTLSGWSERFPVLPFILGMLAGHIFWPQRPRNGG